MALSILRFFHPGILDLKNLNFGIGTLIEISVSAMWILGWGLVGAALAAVAGIIDFTGDHRIRAISDAWQHAIGNVILVLIQLFSFYERCR